MAQEESPEYDVLIVGGGGAGLRAAIAAYEPNPKLKIAVIDTKFPNQRRNPSTLPKAAYVSMKLFHENII